MPVKEDMHWLLKNSWKEVLMCSTETTVVERRCIMLFIVAKLTS